MSSGLKVGQEIKGKIGTYIISAQIHRDAWTAISNSKKVVVKTAPKSRLTNELSVLQQFRGQPCIRQLLDEVQDPRSLILQHRDDNLLSASNSKKLERSDIKYVAKNILQALQMLHEGSYVHTDVKPDNILVNHCHSPFRFAEVELGDCGDVCSINPKEHLMVGTNGHGIGAAMFRSPEAMLNLRWGTPTDIWSFGTTLISLLWGSGWHIFKPDPADASPDDEAYATHVLVKQVAFFGPIPLSYQSLLSENDERWEILGEVTQYIQENKKWKPFSMAQDKELDEEDKAFLNRIMKLDPRDRPTARELLQDRWFCV